jgi:hypothetical protein
MGNYDIDGVGNAEVDKKAMTCDFSISADEFFDQFQKLVEELPSGLLDDVRKAIEKKKETKFDKKYKDDLDDFFYRVKQLASSEDTDAAPSDTDEGFSDDEAEEAKQAEEIKGMESDSETINYGDDDGVIDTFDKKTGKKEGEIHLGEKGATGLLVPLDIVEQVSATYEFNEEESLEDAREISGYFKITNPSENDKIWDADITFKKDKAVDLDDAIKIRNLAPSEEKVIEYSIEEFEEPMIKVTEFVSTLNDEETESYSLSSGDDNVVLFKLTVLNKADYELKNVIIKKQIVEGFMDVKIDDPSIGSAELEGDSLDWTIETLDAESEATISITMSISISDADVKARTGTVSVEYDADKSFTGLEIDKFDAYSNNFVGMQAGQTDDDPDIYDCNVIFRNRSDFQMKIVNLDVKNVDTGKVELDIDPLDIPPVAADASWHSVPWQTETTDGLEPMFYKIVEFFLIANHTISTHGVVTVEDIELAVAMMEVKLDYSIQNIASFRVIPFDALLQVKNIGGADLNEVVIEEVIQEGFIPPKPEEIELYVIRPEEGGDEDSEENSLENVDWENLGEQVEIDESLIEITPLDQEPDAEHSVKINLTELRENAIGMFLPNMIIRVKYPIQSFKAAKGVEYISNVKFIGNTYPAGAPLEMVPDEIRLQVTHIRKKSVKGKTIRAQAESGLYEITLTLQNMGIVALENVEMKDLVPNNFEYSDFSLEPTKYDNLDGKDMLVWTIESIDADEEYTITFKIKGSGDDFQAKDSQLSL